MEADGLFWIIGYFNSRPRVGATPAYRSDTLHPCFNSRPRVGGDSSHSLLPPLSPISIPAPVWGATRLAKRFVQALIISIPAPVWGRPARPGYQPVQKLFQFTPPRGGRLVQYLVGSRPATISIHAPAWGATQTGPLQITMRPISIHAPAWGATRLVLGDSQHDVISIHAPAWGATQALDQGRRKGGISIHAPVWGATIGALRRGSRVHDFNSRPRVGGDGGGTARAHGLLILIHAPVWGATAPGAQSCPTTQISIHAPVWGATPRVPHRPAGHRISIHAPVWGATNGGRYGRTTRRNFNSRPRVGGDPGADPDPAL